MASDVTIFTLGGRKLRNPLDIRVTKLLAFLTLVSILYIYVSQSCRLPLNIFSTTSATLSSDKHTASFKSRKDLSYAETVVPTLGSNIVADISRKDQNHEIARSEEPIPVETYRRLGLIRDEHDAQNRSTSEIDYGAPEWRHKKIPAPSCGALIAGDNNAFQHAEQYLKRSKYKWATDGYLLDLLNSCSEFIAERGYNVGGALSDEEAAYPIAFSIRLHRAGAQAERLLRALYQPQNVYCIHIDKKSPETLHKLFRKITQCFPNVVLASQQQDYVYGSISPVLADVQCMKDLRNTKVKWNYLMNFAGTEFPLKTNLEIVRILKKLNGRNDIESFEMLPYYLHRTSYVHAYDSSVQRYVSTGVHKPAYTSYNITLRKGCSYNTYSRAFVDWVIDSDVAQSFIYWARDTDSPDELVWASLNAYPGAPGGSTLTVTQTDVSFLSRLTVWKGRAWVHLQSKF